MYFNGSSWIRRYRLTQRYIASKAALLTLTWSFVANIIYEMLFQPLSYLRLLSGDYTVPMVYGGSAVILLFYPLAGYLADNKFGRYKTITRSLMILCTTIIVAMIILLPFAVSIVYDKVIIGIWGIISAALMIMIPLIVGFVSFHSNVIQFGMDQLYDSPSDHQTLFIHWYVWLYYLGHLVSQLPWLTIPQNTWVDVPYDANYTGQTHEGRFKIGIALFFLIPSVCALILVFSLKCQRRVWFLAQPASINPYKLVYHISKFARKHKIPINRSAFTYCEDDIPSGLDLAKKKYGGPYTTDEVESVKSFYEILKIVFAMGPIFFLEVSSDYSLFYYSTHIHQYQCYNSTTNSIQYTTNIFKQFLWMNGLLRTIFVIIFIPLYLLILRPFIDRFVPTMLKRIGIGIILTLLALVITLVMDVRVHLGNNNIRCMFFTPTDCQKHQDWYWITVQYFLLALSDTHIYIAMFEFICAQSPHSMKGFLIGMLYATRGLFRALGSLLVITIYFIYALHVRKRHSLPSCGNVYYGVNFIISLTALVIFTKVARKYRYRKRDEVCMVYQYAEEYYSNIVSGKKTIKYNSI